MGPDFVVLLSPVCDLHASIEKVLEPTGAQALLAQPSVETLYVAVLHRPPGLDMAQLDLPLQRPGKEVTTGELRAVVATNRLRPAAPRDDLIKHTGDSPAGEAGIDLQSQALPRERIDHAQNPDGASGSDHIMREVQRPLLVRLPSATHAAN